MPKNEEVKGTKNTKPIILLNRTRARIMVPKPRIDKKGNPQKFACDICTIHAGLNQPIDPAVWALIETGRHRLKLEGDEPELRRLDSVTDLPEMAIDQILQNCGDPPSVKWWLSIEKRAKVRKKIQTWITKTEAKQAKRRERAA